MKVVEVRGMRMPAIGLGTWQLAGRTCRRMVHCALEAGYRHIDTAQVYGNEAEIGRAVSESGLARRDIFVTTKIWLDSLRPEAVRSSTGKSLDRLRMDHVDLLLIHWPDPGVFLSETLHAMEELRHERKTRHIGVSNFPVAMMREAVETHGCPVLCNQVEYHPFLRQDAVLDYARRHDLAVTAYSPLARGIVAGDETLTTIGRKHGKSAPQVALRWLIEQDGVAALPRSSNEAHCRANIDLFDFELDHEDFEAIAGMPRNHRVVDPGWAPDWDAA